MENLASQLPCDIDEMSNSAIADEDDTPVSMSTSSSGANNIFHIDTSLIQAVPTEDQNKELCDLGLSVYNQDDFEQGIIAQVDEAFAKREHQEQVKLLETELKQVNTDVSLVKEDIKHIDKVLCMIDISDRSKETQRRRLVVQNKKEIKEKQLKKLQAKERSISRKLNIHVDTTDSENGEIQEESTLSIVIGAQETEKEILIKTGKMTPFGTMISQSKGPTNTLRPSNTSPSTSKMSDFEKYLTEQTKLNDLAKAHKKTASVKCINLPDSDVGKSQDTQILKKHGIANTNEQNQNDSNFFDDRDKKLYKTESDFSKLKQSRPHVPRLKHNFEEDSEVSDYNNDDDSDEYVPDNQEWKESFADEGFDSGDLDVKTPKKAIKRKVTKRVHHESPKMKEFKLDDEIVSEEEIEEKRKRVVYKLKNEFKDDGCEERYKKRIKAYKRRLAEEKLAKLQADGGNDEDDELSSCEEVDAGFCVPRNIWNKLFPYQKTCVKWLWELHSQQAGGIVGDEMGLGKTIQAIAFLAGLKESNLRNEGFSFRGLGPVVIVCPATVMHQWVKEFHTWYPPIRVAVLHSSGTHSSSKSNLIKSIVRQRGVIVTSYSSLVKHHEDMIKYDWHYLILDEGHKIRNPIAKATVACKQFRTPHRFILSGSPMQNNLKELWSLFDFVFPGKLGTLPDFMEHFSVPITQGGYSNATQVQVQTAYKCACVLRDTINPYLLRRMKADVKMTLQLPNKNEQVLFCRLTDDQRRIYKEYLSSRECEQILAGKYMVFPGLITLRKVCNHPDLATGGPRVFINDIVDEHNADLHYGYWKRSGKMIVVESLLKLWKKQGHRVLLFSQGVQMLDIFEKFVQDKGYTYQRMDGKTSISSRQPLINTFNEDPSLFLFLLTTKVGGLGVNLTGANRVLIFDPDWNPSTDMQARERAWRIGQQKHVTIYRLLTTGTIEEKIYHRQIFKQFLTNRVLKDPKQRRFFKTNDLYELFTLGDEDNKQGTETAAIFAGTGSEVRMKSKSEINRFDELKKEREKEKLKKVIEKEKLKNVERMREMAKMLSQKIVQEDKSINQVGSNDVDMGEDIKETDKPEGMKGSPDMTTRGCDDKPTTTSTTLATTSSSATNTSVFDISIAPQSSTWASTSASTGTVCEKDNAFSKNTSTVHIGKSIKKKKKRKSKKKNRNVLEGERIVNLDRHTVYKHQHSDEEENEKQDNAVLRSLFKKTGVHSAMQHDTIMMSSHPDFALVEAEADRVAHDAAMALKRSRSRCLPASTGIPTWTGFDATASKTKKPRFGKKKNISLSNNMANSTTTDQDSKVPELKHFDGTERKSTSKSTMTSGELLARMRQRNNQSVEVANNESVVSVPTTIENTQQVELITDIRNYIAFQCAIDGQATTEEIIFKFQQDLPPEDSAKFKAMLKQICHFDKINGIGLWMLKQEFR